VILALNAITQCERCDMSTNKELLIALKYIASRTSIPPFDDVVDCLNWRARVMSEMQEVARAAIAQAESSESH